MKMRENNELSTSEEKRRKFIIEGNMWHVMVQLTIPLAVYGLFNYLYGFFDLLMVSHIGDNEVASVVFIDQIKLAMTAFGAGIAAGGSVIVARLYGSNDIGEARKHANAAFYIAVAFSFIAVFLSMVFGRQILSMLNATSEIINAGMSYYQIQMLTTGIMAINSVYMGLEKAKGNTKTILALNLIAMIIKLILSAIFVFVLNLGMMYVAIATLIGQMIIMFVAMFILFNKKNSLRLDLRLIRMPKSYYLSILIISFPVITGKFLFSLGKVLVNSMASFYGSSAVAALGIATKIAGGPGSIAVVFDESEASVISQNLGSKKLKRALDSHRISMLIGFSVATIGMIFVSIYVDKLIPLFTNQSDPVYYQMIKDIFKYERFSSITSSMIAIIAGLFIGFKFTKVSFLLNVTRLFLFRLPLLIILRQIGVNYIALGYIMFYSNILTMILGFICFFIFKHKLKHHGYNDMYLNN
jgi:putative MATE family efflux protein